MDNKNDIIVQIDESTKEVMQQVKDSLCSGVTEQIDRIAQAGKNNSDNIEQVLKKLKDFSGIKTSIEELSGLAQETQQLKDEIVPIAQTLESMKNETTVKLTGVEGSINNIKQQTSEIEKLQNQLSALDTKLDTLVSNTQAIQISIDKLQYCMDIVINLVTPFWKKLFKKQES